MEKLSGKTALVTGSTDGVGRLVARSLHSRSIRNSTTSVDANSRRACASALTGSRPLSPGVQPGPHALHAGCMYESQPPLLLSGSLSPGMSSPCRNLSVSDRPVHPTSGRDLLPIFLCPL